jgi:uncharacterized protein (TIGR03083 family)
MPDNAQTWKMIHTERTSLADTIEDLTPEQWESASLCGNWTIGVLAAHILAGAEQTPGNFLRGMATAGFRFDTMVDRDARRRQHLRGRPPAAGPDRHGRR